MISIHSIPLPGAVLDIAAGLGDIGRLNSRSHPVAPQENPMAKAVSLKIKLLSSADTGYFYVTKKNSRTKTDKFAFKKYDPIARKHVAFKETKIK